MQLIKSTYVETKQFSSEANENKFLNDYGFAKLTTLKKIFLLVSLFVKKVK